ncbi:PIN domain-containing protein [Pseudomonas sp. FP1740]|uniref:PIN domain-containing protein n=1 Tax=Pseudomonas sp. FP1740 TaxID=2954078 RepID=UPI002734092C|nr:PIN domain-containing protein [Pseudomonas sp. FP1740]WLG46669.1 PIN domain-containing protein [Pseudomonas sp. FP1740]
MTDNRQLYVLCDTNAAVRDAHLFRKKGGPLLVAMLRAKKAKLLVPEVLRMEYINQFIQAGDDARDKAMKELDKLKTFCGYDMSGFLPRPQFGEAQALEILAQLEDVIHIIPTTPELKVAAADRSINGVRPTSKTDHGYKDCLIWESLLTLPGGSEVLLLSRDEAAFFDKGVLAPNLEKEAKEKGLFLTAYNTTKNPTLTPLIDALKERFVDVAALAPGELPMDDHPIIQAYMQLERVAPVLPKDPDEEVHRPVVAVAGELEELLAVQTRPFTLLDAKALGFVSYLRSTGKQALIGLLVQSGVEAEAARNALERLALLGLIRDIGHLYLAVEGRHADMAAQLVEPEMIKLIGLGS